MAVELAAAEYVAGIELGEHLWKSATKLGDPAFAIAARRCLGSVSFYVGESARSIEHMEWVLAASLPPEEVRAHSASYEVVDAYVAAHAYLGWSSWMLGDPARACRESDRAVEVADELGSGSAVRSP